MSLDYCFHAKGDAGTPRPMIAQQCAQAIIDAGSQQATHDEQCRMYELCGQPARRRLAIDGNTGEKSSIISQ